LQSFSWAIHSKEQTPLIVDDGQRLATLLHSAQELVTTSMVIVLMLTSVSMEIATCRILRTTSMSAILSPRTRRFLFQIKFSDLLFVFELYSLFSYFLPNLLLNH
jgi:hypothetical protein